MSNSLENSIIHLLQTTSLFSSTQRDCHQGLTQQQCATIPPHILLINSECRGLKAPFIFHVAPEHAAAEPLTFSKLPVRLLIIKVFRNEELCQ